MAGNVLPLAVAVKAARQEAAKIAREVAAPLAEKVARSIVPEKGEPGYTPRKGVDYFDGVDGATPVKGVDYFDGITPKKGVDYWDGKDGVDGTKWHLFDDEPSGGKDGEFGIYENCIYHKDGEWQRVLCLQEQSGGLTFMQPRAYSDAKIETIVQRLNTRLVARYTEADTAVVCEEDDVILANGQLTVTLPAAADNDGCTFRIKNIGNQNVTVEAADAGLIDGEDCQILNIRNYAIDVISVNGAWYVY